MLQMSSSSDYDRQKNNNNSGGRSSRNKKKGAPFMFFSNILRKKKILGFEEIREMNTRTRSEPSGKWGRFRVVIWRHAIEWIFHISPRKSAELLKQFPLDVSLLQMKGY